jgi:hypothetical protein
MLRCPKCVAEDPSFFLQVWIAIDNEGEPIGDFDLMEPPLEDEMKIECSDCGLVGTVKEFRAQNVDYSELANEDEGEQN